MNNLTNKEEEILNCIKEYIASYGYPPTIREICKIKNYSSTSTIHTYINKLIEKGFIKKDTIKNRSIKLLVENEYTQKKYINIPVLNNNSFIEFPISLIKKNKDIYAYIMNDNSLLDEHILKNDILFIVKQKNINFDDIIAYTDKNNIYIKKNNNTINQKNILGKVIYIFRNI